MEWDRLAAGSVEAVVQKDMAKGTASQVWRQRSGSAAETRKGERRKKWRSSCDMEKNHHES